MIAHPSSCAICVAPLVTKPSYEPIGRGGGLVALCPACSPQPPKRGRPRKENASMRTLYARKRRERERRTRDQQEPRA